MHSCFHELLVSVVNREVCAEGDLRCTSYCVWRPSPEVEDS